MQILPPTLILCVLCFLNLLVLLWIHLTKPKDIAQGIPPVVEPAQDGSQETWRIALKRLGTGANTLQPEVIGVMLLIIALLMAWIVSPGNKQEGFTFPGTAGQPFYAFSYVRGIQRDIVDLYPSPIVAATVILCIILLTLARIRQSMQLARTSLLLTAIACASLAQLAMNDVYLTSAPRLYLLAVAIFLFWALLARDDLKDLLLQIRWSPWMEWTMLALVLGLTIFARFYALDRVPFGIEGDESKWTVEVINAIVHGAYPHGTAYHLFSVPLSFFMQAPFHLLFGPGLNSARLAVVFFSSLGSLVFYFLVRRLFNAPIAWTATFLLAVSMLDVSASRLANVESHVKIWPLLTLLLLLRAVERMHWLSFLLAGITTCLGLLTYDTVAPLVVLALVIIMIEFRRQRTSLSQSIQAMSAFLAPQLIILPFIGTYWIGRLGYYGFGANGKGEDVWNIYKTAFLDVVHAVIKQTPGDFLYNRHGPLISSLLVPALLLGLILLIVFMKQRGGIWMALMLGLYFFPVPILASSPFGRVFYPGLPALYVFIALGIVAIFIEIKTAVGPGLRPVLTTFAIFVLLIHSISNLYLYFNEVLDPWDRVVRRELYEVGLSLARPDDIVYFPYIPKTGQPIEYEFDQVIELGFEVNPALEAADYQFEAIHLHDLLPALRLEAPPFQRTIVVWDKDVGHVDEQRNDILDAIRRCYPGLEEVSWIHHQLLFLPQEVLDNPICHSGTLTLAPQDQWLEPSQPAGFTWTMNGASVETLDLMCTQDRDDLLTIEAETLKGPGFEKVSRFVSDFGGSGFLADTLGEGTATISITDAPSDPLYLWVRSYRRFQDPYPARIGVEGQMTSFASSDEIPLNEWTWERIGPLTIGPTPFELRIERPYDPDPEVFIALFIDRIILTSSAAFDPGLDSLVEPSLARSLVLEPNATHGSFELELDPGSYQCMLTASSQDKLISHLGTDGIQSNPVEITIEPLQ